MKHEMVKLNPYWITGFVDAEGCFSVKIHERKSYKTEWFVQPAFVIRLHKRDKNILIKIQICFDSIVTFHTDKNLVTYTVSNQRDLVENILLH